MKKEKGIVTTNCYPKSSFKQDDNIYVGCFKRELAEDFYFYNNYDKKIYLIKKDDDVDTSYTKEEFNGKIKYLIPISTAELVWEDKPYVELPNKSFKDITLREYACIHTKVPESGTDWLDEIIKQAK